MADKFTVGTMVTVLGRGSGMLDMDNQDGTWNVGFEDGSDGDIPLAQISLKADPIERIALAGGARVVPQNRWGEDKPPGWSRFVCFSDTHGLHYQIPKAHYVKADVLLHAGDFSNTGELEQVQSFANWLKEYPATHKAVIAGNHDVTFHPSFYEDAWSQYHRQPYNCEDVRRALTDSGCCTYLEDAETEIMGYRIYGSPWQPAFCDWAFNLPRGQACNEAWDKIPSDVDVLMVHGPAFGMQDETSSGFSAGCEQLLHAIRARDVPVFVTGHIHEGYGIDVDGVTMHINASTCNLSYRPTNPPIVFDLPPVAHLRHVSQAMAAASNAMQD